MFRLIGALAVLLAGACSGSTGHGQVDPGATTPSSPGPTPQSTPDAGVPGGGSGTGAGATSDAGTATPGGDGGTATPPPSGPIPPLVLAPTPTRFVPPYASDLDALAGGVASGAHPCFAGLCWWNYPVGGSVRWVVGAASDLWAAGPATLLHFDGSRWSAVAPPATTLVGIWAGPGSASIVTQDGATYAWSGAWSRVADAPLRAGEIAGGASGAGGVGWVVAGAPIADPVLWDASPGVLATAALRFEAGSWTRLDRGEAGAPLGATSWQAAPGAVFVGAGEQSGWKGHVFQVSATGWTERLAFDGAAFGLSGTATDDLWLSTQSMDMRCDARWPPFPTPVTAHLDAAGWTWWPGTGGAVAGGPRDVWINCWHLSGEHWEPVLDTPEEVLWAGGAADAWGARWQYHPGEALSHFDGTSWVSPVRLTWSLRLLRDGLVLTQDATPPATHQLARFDGTGWIRLPGSALLVDPPPETGANRGAWAGASDDVWVATAAGFAHFDGRGWTLAGGDTAACGAQISGMATDDLWATGYQAGTCHWDGKTWSRLPDLPDPRDAVGSIWSDRPGSAWAFGYRWEGTPPPSSVMVTRHVLLHWTGNRWEEVLLGTPGLHEAAARWYHIGGASPSDAWAFGSAGTYRFDGSTWTEYAADASCPQLPELTNVWRSPAGETWALAEWQRGGGVYRFDGRCWVSAIPGRWTSSAGRWLTDDRGGLWSDSP